MIVSSLDDDALAPDWSRRDCRLQARERPAVASRWIGPAEINACGHRDLVLALIEALHLNTDSRIVHVLVLKVDALQQQDLAFWRVWA